MNPVASEAFEQAGAGRFATPAGLSADPAVAVRLRLELALVRGERTCRAAGGEQGTAEIRVVARMA